MHNANQRLICGKYPVIWYIVIDARYISLAQNEVTIFNRSMYKLHEEVYLVVVFTIYLEFLTIYHFKL
jgi:hypothetical protein